ncbi:MAG TPA: HD domain-containing protein [Candidatus Nanoarchaeia archaeon]|nr:HD domain-containing protein [Candidatus Nanoarchaeia archaeon]
MENNLISILKNFVREKCVSENSKYGEEVYEAHFVPMVEYARELVRTHKEEEEKIDEEVVEISSWLHDIGSIIYGRKDHHITGAKIAEKKLRDLSYPEEKIKKVKKCILNHRGSRDNSRETKEEQIVAEADAMSNFDNLPGIFKASLVHEKKTQEESRKEVIKKLQNKYNQLSEKGKKLIKPRYDAAMLLLK